MERIVNGEKQPVLSSKFEGALYHLIVPGQPTAKDLLRRAGIAEKHFVARVGPPSPTALALQADGAEPNMLCPILRAAKITAGRLLWPERDRG